MGLTKKNMARSRRTLVYSWDLGSKNGNPGRNVLEPNNGPAFALERWRRCMISRKLCLFAGTAILVLFTPAARAATVPDATYDIFVNGTTFDAPGSYANGTASASILDLPDPSMQAGLNGAGTSSAQLFYHFEVDGPVIDTPVPMVISFALHLSISGESLASDALWGSTAQLTAASFDASISQYDYAFAALDCFKPTGLPPVCAGGTTQDLVSTLQLTVLSGELANVNMLVDANDPDPAVFRASIDPEISFAPSFDSTGYTITLSDGISNQASVPEPSTLWLAGLGIAGCIARRARRRRTGLAS
jgi:hypothetical protein